MSKKNSDNNSTTDFFLKFISREKQERKKEDTNKNENNISAKEKAFTLFFKSFNFINETMDKMLSSKLSIKIFSFVMTIVFVFVINGGSINSILSTPSSGDYLVNVNVVPVGLSNDHEVTGLPDNVSVILVGPSLDIYKVKLMGNYEIYVDLNGLGEGEHTVELKSQNFPPSLQVAIIPGTATIKIVPKVTATYELGHRFVNYDKIDSKYSVAVDSMKHQQVEVRGAKDTIDKIYSVQANIDLTGVDKSFTQDAVIYAYDRSGTKLNVEIIPNKVNVSCSVASYSKEVPVIPRYNGELLDGYSISKATFSKEKVTIYGSENDLKTINEVYVDIDVSNLSETRTINDLSIGRIKGVNKMSVDKIDVTLEIQRTTTKQISDIKINLIGNVNNYRVAFNGNENAILNIVGATTLVNKLTVNDIVATIDLSNRSTGYQKIPVNIQLPTDLLTYQFVSESEIYIEVENGG